MDLFTDDLFSKFEDLIGDDEDDEVDSITSDDSFHLTVEVQPMNAKSLSLGELQHECTKRGIKFSGFIDDAHQLQEAFDREHEEYIQIKRRESLEAKRAQSQLRSARARNRQKHRILEEEKRALAADAYAEKYLEHISNSKCHEFCRLEINDETGRLLAKAMSQNISIVHLDLSGMFLSDLTGSFLFRSLEQNRSVVKLDLSENCFRWKTLFSLANSLGTNECLRYINIASNTMTCIDDNWRMAFEKVSNMLLQNTSLSYLSIWNCRIGPDAGDILLNGLRRNKSMTCLDTGYNKFSIIQERDIDVILERNNNIRQLRNENERKKLDEIEKEHSLKLLVKKEEDDRLNREAWLEEQKYLRAHERRMQLENQWKFEEDKHKTTTNQKVENCTRETKKKSTIKKKKTKKSV